MWYTNKENIVNPAIELPVLSHESYKLHKPRQIYHLDLQPTLAPSFVSSDSANSDSVASSASNSDYPLTSTVDSASVAAGNPSGNSGANLSGNLSSSGISSNGISAVSAEKSILPSLTSGEIDNSTFNSTLASLSLNESPGTFQAQAQTQAQTQTLTPSASSHPPPGMTSTLQNINAVPLLTSDKINWFYVDPLGTEQGPFNGDTMQEWLTGGYLHLDLNIRRLEESSYRPLKELCEKVQNYIQPFKVPLPDLTVRSAPVAETRPLFPPFGSQGQVPQFSSLGQQQQQQSQFHPLLSGGPNLGRINSGLGHSQQQSGLFGNDFMSNDPFSAQGFQNSPGANQFGIDSINRNLGFNSGLQINTMPALLQLQIQQQQSQPGLSRNNSGWGSLDHSTGLMSNSNPATPLSVNPVLPGQITQPTPISPWISGGIQSLSRVSSPFVASSTISNNNSNSNNNVSSAEVIDTVAADDVVVNDDHVLSNMHSSVVNDFLDDDHFKQEVPAPALATEKSEKTENSEPAVNEQQAKAGPEQEAEPEQELEDEEIVSAPVVETLKPSVPNQQELAPWASSKNPEAEQKPAMTLKEIQQLEAERLEKQKQLLAQQRAEVNRAWAQAEEKAAAEQKVPALPPTTSWGAVPVQTVAKKTLAEIQKEEAEAAAARAKAAKASAAASGLPVQKASFASALTASSTPKDDGVWQTVAVKKPTVKKPVAPSITNAASSSRATPQVLRSVSATRPAVSGSNSLALREDFLIWARSNMTNLYPTVSKDDLLDMFITLPASSSDSGALIAETIYASSATMDGRRFAQEFLKRRQKVDQQIGKDDDVSWSSAIISSADKLTTVDEDGWSTNVKSKKKKRT